MLDDKVQVSPRARTQSFILASSPPTAAATGPEPGSAGSLRTLRQQRGPDEDSDPSLGRNKATHTKAQRLRESQVVEWQTAAHSLPTHKALLGRPQLPKTFPKACPSWPGLGRRS